MAEKQRMNLKSIVLRKQHAMYWISTLWFVLRFWIIFPSVSWRSRKNQFGKLFDFSFTCSKIRTFFEILMDFIEFRGTSNRFSGVTGKNAQNETYSYFQPHFLVKNLEYVNSNFFDKGSITLEEFLGYSSLLISIVISLVVAQRPSLTSER